MIGLIERIAKVLSYTIKIDSAAVLGLAGTSNSLAYKVHEVEKHFHNSGRWYGADPGDGFLVEGGLVAWQLVAGAGGAFGNWLQLSDGDEIASGPRYDPHQMLFTQASAAGKCLVQSCLTHTRRRMRLKMRQGLCGRHWHMARRTRAKTAAKMQERMGRNGVFVVPDR